MAVGTGLDFITSVDLFQNYIPVCNFVWKR